MYSLSIQLGNFWQIQSVIKAEKLTTAQKQPAAQSSVKVLLRRLEPDLQRQPERFIRAEIAGAYAG